MNPLNETVFEQHISEFLANSRLYNQRTSNDFDREALCDREMVERFLRLQTKEWNKLAKHFPDEQIANSVIREYFTQLNRGKSMLRILLDGVTVRGAKFRFVQFEPQLGGKNSDSYRLYENNRFSVVRQMRYCNEHGNELDLVILINGLPIITFELKNEGTGQNFNNGIFQYRNDRSKDDRFLKACLVHFVMDNSFVFMTTKLNDLNTRFLPFNIDTVNPVVDNDYPTSYMWRSILQADSLLDIIKNFIKVVDNNKVVFPRFHQLRAVRKLRRFVREDGPGHNYLIQHSAGSGKTMSMAWLAHQMANMTNDDNTPIFDSIIMVTDRIVLDKALAEAVMKFETKVGTVKDIRKGSVNLARALNDGYRIIVSTVQKFAYALPNIRREKQRNFAIIVDEAHTAIGNESAKDITAALSTDEDLKNATDFSSEDYDSQLDSLMAYIQTMRRKMEHISYFAFTATPKDKTLALFGKDGHPHDLYSMRQAIDEGFILDVLKYYKSYMTMFELVEKEDIKSLDERFGKRKALKVIFKELNKNHYIKLRKAVMVVDHFMKHTLQKIGHRAKAMLVCDSRRSAVDYKIIIDKILEKEYNGTISTLVAFSGEVEDDEGRKYTESSMNDEHATDNDIRDLFMSDKYKILIVAEKFQTGFDQPLLHTMYVDKLLGGIQCVQTLSRLNRCYPGKEDTMIIDFRNDVDKIRKSFESYYTSIMLDGEVDTQRLYRLRDDVSDFRVFSEEDVNIVVEALCIDKNVSKVPSFFSRIVRDRVNPMEDADKEKFRKMVNRYVRQYGFMAQLMEFSDPDLEKFYVFCKFLYKYLPYTKETLPMEIVDRFDLNKLRIQQSFEGRLTLEGDGKKVDGPRIGEPGVPKPDEEKTIAEILDIVNSPFEGYLNENDSIVRQIWNEVLADREITEAFLADNTYDDLMKFVKDKFDDKMASEIEKYYNFAELLEKNHGFSVALISKFVNALAQRVSKHKDLPYDEIKLKKAIFDNLKSEFEGVCGKTLRNFDEFVDTLFSVLDMESLPKLDGVDELLKNSFNNLFVNMDLNIVGRRSYFTMILSKYEAYLKKLYFLINGSEIEGRNGKSPSLHDAIFSFECLWNLRCSTTPEFKKFSYYLELLRKWRNEESHLAPTADKKCIDEAVCVVTTMYLFVTGSVITELEMSSMLVTNEGLAAENK